MVARIVTHNRAQQLYDISSLSVETMSGHICVMSVMSGNLLLPTQKYLRYISYPDLTERETENGLQSSQPKFRRRWPLVYILITTKQSMRVIHMTLMTMTLRAWETGSTKLGTTPGGGVKNGVWERSM